LSLIRSKNINKLFVCQKHSTTAISLYAKIIQNHLWIFSSTYALLVLIPVFRYHCATRKASYGYHLLAWLSVRFLSPRSRTSTAKFLWLLLSIVIHKQCSVLFQK